MIINKSRRIRKFCCRFQKIILIVIRAGVISLVEAVEVLLFVREAPKVALRNGVQALRSLRLSIGAPFASCLDRLLQVIDCPWEALAGVLLEMRDDPDHEVMRGVRVLGEDLLRHEKVFPG